MIIKRNKTRNPNEFLDVERYSDRYLSTEQVDFMKMIDLDSGLFPDEVLGRKNDKRLRRDSTGGPSKKRGNTLVIKHFEIFKIFI